MSVAIACIGDVFDFVRNGKSVKQEKGSGGIPITRIETISNRMIDPERVGFADLEEKGNEKWLLKHGDILFSHINSVDHVGKCALYEGVPSKLIHGMNLLALRPNKSLLDARYAFRALSGPNFRASLLPFVNKAVNQASVSTANLKGLQIPLPPLAEQRRIAAILDKADALRRKRKRALELLDSLTQSIFHKMFAHDNCTSVRLADLVDPADRINYGVIQPGDPTQNGISLVRAGDLRRGTVDRSNLRTISLQISDQYIRSVLKGGEILIGCVGSIGEIAVASDEDRGSNIARAVARVPLKKDVSRTYVAEYLRTPKVQNYFKSELRTVAQPTLNIKQIAETRVAIPSESQIRIFETATDQVRQNIASLINSEQRLEHLFASLQHRAFCNQI